ncbi:hypothetical protein [Rathayibacter rathayi]|uniref:Phosphodiesterase n=1 Tax=Rathayibacter rathayi TaxID=33887 RepID=A0ABX5A800_RATRA|nr:hypothetical protein [Rathayibacter rathayi]AZZ47818.1 hypothetical protein C1O28_00240 [Rathayibacter rathayi]MWV75070.1 hypothetical protein [Rathayibacter rathayi NCPPB 2980 = VKM Ac-1601]PPF26116.1 hypothetical protein C5C34_01425 [Rathayibacter rathayi]PPF51391.1 hypothetical protein C5C08_03160 [Rathayibacter rathayi]PPG65770.1 hypothetical protein C5C16_12530 [Rathayibacter rathayi]
MTGRTPRLLRFGGRIAGFGTASGTRIVLGLWAETPFGAFADAMIETRDGHRLLIAPTREVADFIGSTYSFDEVRVAPVSWRRIAGGLTVSAGPLAVSLRLGGLTPLGRLLRIVPRPVAEHPAWLCAISPVAALLAPGVRKAGSAGNGRREFYGVRAIRRVEGVHAVLAEEDLGPLRPLSPPVRFGFSSAPAAPAIVDVTTTITTTITTTEKGAAS